MKGAGQVGEVVGNTSETAEVVGDTSETGDVVGMVGGVVGGNGKFGDTGEVRGKIDELVEMLRERVGSRSETSKQGPGHRRHRRSPRAPSGGAEQCLHPPLLGKNI